MIPDKYQWLNKIGILPKMVGESIRYIGLKEIPGTQSNLAILAMAKELGLSKIYTNDDISWCGLFISHIMRVTGKPLPDTKGDPYNRLRAKWFLNWGRVVDKGDERLGDVMIFDRDPGGHVGLYIAESGSTFHIVGGNQSNAVTIAEIAKQRCIGVRRFYATSAPASAKKYTVDSSGKLSTNEA